jgi:hypothetical protein
VFAFWVPLGVFGVWMAAMTVRLLRAIALDDGKDARDTQLEQLTARVAELAARLDDRVGDSHPAAHS